MPIYEYRCGSCSHELDALQKISDSPLRKCPECGKLTLRRMMSAPAFRLKGGGWYETDFKGGDKKRNLVETSPSESSSSESSESSKSVDSAKSEAPAKAESAAKETKKPAAPTASEVKKPRKTRAAGPTRT
jgi:putative FmdB family regulatory protein